MAANRTIAFGRNDESEEDMETSSMNLNMNMNMNMTMPTFDYNRYDADYSLLASNDSHLKLTMQNFSRNALIEQDPRTLPDETRESLMREKRRLDSYKTALCEQFKRTGTCPYDKACRFAHTVEELRLQNAHRGRNHPKYKTVLCDKFTTSGTCRYGNRCQFIHRLKNDVVIDQLRGHTEVNLPSTGSLLDMNQSLPVRPDDIARAFNRSAAFNQQSVQRLARVSDREFLKQLRFMQ